MNPLFTQVETVIDEIRRSSPELYKLAVPRRIIPPNGYANPKLYGMFIAAGAFQSHRPHQGDTIAPTQVAAAARLIEFKIPTYFVSDSFVRAVAATTPPKDTKISDLKWPMPAMLFVLPLAFSKEYCGAIAPFLSIIQAPPRAYTVNNGPYGTTIQEETRIIIHAQCFHGTAPVDYINVTRVSKDVEALMCAEFVAWDDDVEKRKDWTDPESYNCPSKEKEIEIANKCNALATKLLMAMNARPEMVEEGELARPAKVRHNVEVREALWHPNMIGRQYRILYEPGHKPDGSHASPRMHWRRGHMRNQKHGRNLCDTKLIWIDPVLVNSEMEKEKV